MNGFGRSAPLELLLLPLVWATLHVPDRRGATLCMLLLGAGGLVLWIRNLKLQRTLLDTPLARIASAAQGYVALRGRLLPFDGGAMTLPGNGMPCVWFSCEVQERVGDRWRTVSRNQSEESLRLADDSGECLVFWEQASMLGLHCDTTQRADERVIECWLAPGDVVTVIGELRTRLGDQGDLALDAEVGALLDAWKRDRPTLLRRFDRNGDGQIDVAAFLGSLWGLGQTWHTALH